MDSDTLWLSLTLVDLAVGRDVEWGGNGLVAGSSWEGIDVGGGVSEDLSISITLADQVGPIAVSTIVVGGIAVAKSAITAVDSWVAVAISTVENGGISLGISSNDCGKSEKSNLQQIKLPCLNKEIILNE